MCTWMTYLALKLFPPVLRTTIELCYGETYWIVWWSAMLPEVQAIYGGYVFCCIHSNIALNLGYRLGYHFLATEEEQERIQSNDEIILEYIEFWKAAIKY